MTAVLIFVSIIGLCVSLYAFFIERKLKEDKSYQPACNISDKMSCTKPLESPYGKLLGFSNSILGLIFYPSMAILAVFGSNLILVLVTTGLFLFTLYLAYVLFAKVKTICLICVTIYAVNVSLFFLSIYKYLGNY